MLSKFAINMDYTMFNILKLTIGPPNAAHNLQQQNELSSSYIDHEYCCDLIFALSNVPIFLLIANKITKHRNKAFIPATLMS